MTVTRWTFDDGTDSVTLPINPSDMGGSLFQELSVTAYATLSGRILLTEGAPTPGTITFSGDILEQSHYDLFVTWRPAGAHGRRRITITDHFGREISGVLTSWQPTPKRSPAYPWRHTFTASFLVLQVDDLAG